MGTKRICLMMAQTAKKASRVGHSLSGKTDSGENIDPAFKKLIDDLIVPHLVEEFLRLYGPAAASKSSPKNNIHSQNQS